MPIGASSTLRVLTSPKLLSTRRWAVGRIWNSNNVTIATVQPLWWTLTAVWIALVLGGMVALRQQQIPWSWAIGAALVAGAFEASCYAAAGFAQARERVRTLPHRAFWLVGSALPPYLIYSFGAGTFRWPSFLLLIALSAAIAWWFEVLPAGGFADGAFLALMACGLLTELAGFFYPPISAKIKSDYIGRVLWLRLGYWAVLVVRDRGDMGFGFIPKRKDWIVGLRYSAYCVAAASVVLWLVQPMRLKDHLSWSLTPWVALGTFVGFLWVVALSEELFARGVLQGDLSRALGSDWAGVVVTSAIFGLVHLSYGREFPNWRMVALAGVLGLFCGRAAQVGGSIRAGMVTHALVVTLFRVLLTKR